MIITSQERDYWIRIENLKQYLTNIPRYHPDDPRYLMYWKGQKKILIEGMWGQESNGHRYCPGVLYGYGNFYTIKETDHEKKSRFNMRPSIRDLEWHRAYNFLEAQGFSGFADDDEYSCDEALLDEKVLNFVKQVRPSRYDKMLKPDGTLKTYITARECLKKLHDKPLGLPLYNNYTKNIMELGCFGKDVGIRMFDGSVKSSQNIKVGDELMGVDSTKRTVKDVYTGKNLMYKVKSKYNEEYIVSDSHTLITNKGNTSIDDAYNNRLKAETAIIQYPEKDLMWDPYLLGLWLGDGFKREKMICGAFDDDKETLEWLIEHFKTNTFIERYTLKEQTNRESSLGTKPMYRINWVDSRMKYKNNWFSNTLQNNKHIPKEYMINSLDNRLKLLAGMIDTDGNYDGKRFTITNCDHNLILQFQELARSCGFRTYISSGKTGITNSLKHNLRITGKNIGLIPTKLPRKQAFAYIHFHKDIQPNIIKIEPIGVDDFYGIEVDGDHLIVLEDYTITHNTRGGGKSYWASWLAVYLIVTDSMKVYDITGEIPAASVCIGSSNSDKSSELCQKVEDGLNFLAISRDLGVYGDENSDEYEPNPFYKNMAGSLEINNKRNPYRHEYVVLHKGKKIKRGTGSSIFHVSYSTNKRSGDEAAAGGRYNLSLIEETGLCFSPNTLIRMSDLSLKEIKDIQVGEYVLGHLGKPEKVISVQSGEEDMFKVKQAHGIDYIVSKNHVMYLNKKFGNYHNNQPTYIKMFSQDFNKLNKCERQETYGVKNECLHFDNTPKLTIEPYWLGAWIGDGTKSTANITAHNDSKELIDYIYEYASRLGMRVSVSNTIDKCSTYAITKTSGVRNYLKTCLTNYGILTEKRIPKDYQLASEEERLELLGGLIATDGCYVNTPTDHYYEFYQTNREDLVEDVRLLAKNLGFKVSLRVQIISTGYDNKELGVNRNKYTLRIAGDIHRIPVKIKRKIAKIRILKKHINSCRIEIESLGYGKYCGITLENNPLHLLLDGTIVHNCENVIAVHKSNSATLSTDGERFGTEIYLGTSGNMELIAGTRKIFENPRDFHCLEFDDVFEGTNNKIGFFIPYYMVDMRFKDEDGNTNLDEAKQFAIDKRKSIKTKDALNGEKMNSPIIPSEMWITREMSILPKEEAKEVKKRLLSDYTYKNRTFVDLIWDSTQPNGVKYKIIPEEEAIVMDSHQESQGSNEKKNKKGKSTECDIIVYEFPDVSKYNDLYKFIGVDPYVAEEKEGGESLGSCFILKNPKYISEGISGDIVVAEITGKYSSRKDFNTKIEKLLAFYGNPQRSLMFEANRGDDIKEHFLKRNKEELLALSPVKFEDSKVLAKVRLSYGYTVGNDIAKLHNLNQLAEWLLEETTLYGETKKNIERIGSLGLLDEIIEYDWELDKAHKANYDRISALTGCIVARRENYNQLTKDEQPRKYIDLSAFGQKSIIKKLKSKNVWQTSSKMDSFLT